MSSIVSQSPKPDDHILSRQEKDDSYSTGAGRKATEKPKPDRPGHQPKGESKDCKHEPPIGLDNETKGSSC